MYAALAQTLYLVGHNIPLFLMAFGILYLILAFIVRPAGGYLDISIASLAIAASLGWFIVSGANPFGVWLQPDVLTVLGFGIVGVVLARVFAGGH